MVQTQQLYKSSTQARPGLTQARLGSTQAGHRCNYCYTNFSNVGTLRVHIKAVHLPPELTQARLSSIQAQLGLTQAQLGSTMTLQEEIKCDICDQFFDTKGAVKKHAILNHSGQVKCEICRKSFNQIKELTRHMPISHPTAQTPGINSVAILGKSR